MVEIVPWWVTSDPDHPYNTRVLEPQKPLMTEPEAVVEPQPLMTVALAPDIPASVSTALHAAQAPESTDDERKAAVRVLLEWQESQGLGGAEHVTSSPADAPISDAHPSTIPDDLIPTEYQAKGKKG